MGVISCPTCGAWLADNESLDPGIAFDSGCKHHQCNPRRAAARDGAMKSDPDDHEPRRRSYDQRLAAGFGMLDNEDSLADD
jgi:hypothetical protein